MSNFSCADIRRLCNEVDGKPVATLSDEQRQFVDFACLYGRGFGIALAAWLPDEKIAEFRKLFLSGSDKAVLNDFQRENLIIRVIKWPENRTATISKASVARKVSRSLKLI